MCSSAVRFFLLFHAKIVFFAEYTYLKSNLPNIKENIYLQIKIITEQRRKYILECNSCFKNV